MSLTAFLASKDHVLKLYEGKMTVATIARLYRIKEGDARKHIRKWRAGTIPPHELFIEDKEEVIKAFDSGMTRRDIARKWEVSVATVNKHLARWGHGQAKAPEPPGVQTLSAILKMRTEGATYEAIGTVFGVSETTAMRYVEKALKMRDFPADSHVLLLPNMPKGLRGLEAGDTVKMGNTEYVFVESQKRVGGRLWMFRTPSGARESFTEWQLRDGKPVIMRKGSGETADVVCG